MGPFVVRRLLTVVAIIPVITFLVFLDAGSGPGLSGRDHVHGPVDRPRDDRARAAGARLGPPAPFSTWSTWASSSGGISAGRSRTTGPSPSTSAHATPDAAPRGRQPGAGHDPRARARGGGGAPASAALDAAATALAVVGFRCHPSGWGSSSSAWSASAGGGSRSWAPTPGGISSCRPSRGHPVGGGHRPAASLEPSPDARAGLHPHRGAKGLPGHLVVAKHALAQR